MANLPGGGGSGSGASFDPGAYVDDGRILYGKLLGTLLGAGWLTWIGGWIAVERAIVSVHMQVIRAAQQMYVRIINAVLLGGAQTIRHSWAEAYQAAVETSPVLAPLTLILDIIVVSAVLLYVKREVI